MHTRPEPITHNHRSERHDDRALATSAPFFCFTFAAICTAVDIKASTAYLQITHVYLVYAHIYEKFVVVRAKVDAQAKHNINVVCGTLTDQAAPVDRGLRWEATRGNLSSCGSRSSGSGSGSGCFGCSFSFYLANFVNLMLNLRTVDRSERRATSFSLIGRSQLFQDCSSTLMVSHQLLRLYDRDTTINAQLT